MTAGDSACSAARRENLRILLKTVTHKAPFRKQNNNNKREQRNKGEKKKSNNNTMVPEAQDAMNRFKMEAANEVGVNLKQGYNGDLTSKQAGSIGGQMVKKMIKSYEESMK